MIVALILLVLLLGTGFALWLHDRFLRSRNPEEKEEIVEPPDECCGMHITCERDSLLASVSPTIEYYDDEELDVYRDRIPQSYTDTEVEQFRDILLTMKPEDIAGWARSLQLRQVALPEAVRDELIMIVAEARRSHSNHDA